MNNFGVDLTGKKAIYSKSTFYKPNTTRITRTFTCEGGPGCLAVGGVGTLGLLFGPRTISGRWADGQRDTIDSGQLEAYVDAAGNEVEAVAAKVKVDAYVVETPGDSSPVPVETETTPKAKKRPAEKAQPNTSPVVPASAGEKVWNEARLIELFKAGMKISDIAVEMGYAKGQGNNRTKAALKKAGLL